MDIVCSSFHRLRAECGAERALDLDAVDSPLELRFPHDVRHLAGPGLVVGRIGPLGDGDGKDA